MNLKDFIAIRKSLIQTTVEESNISGIIENIQPHHTTAIESLEECILDLKDEEGTAHIAANAKELEGQNISIELAHGEFPNYFETFADLINKHPYSFDLLDYYVHEGNISPDSTEDGLMSSYKSTLKLIEFLKDKSDYDSNTGGELTLYFHMIGKSLILPVKYSTDDLKTTKVDEIEVFVSSFSDGLHQDDRKNLFKHELIDFYAKKNKKFGFLLKDWNVLNENYLHSFDSYLEGFSFEKIKTSSLSYFQEMSDKIHETIRKVSNYLFAIPIAFLFLVSRLDFEEPSATKNFGLLFLGYLFFILIWWIFFKNIKESLDAVKKEILRYEEKIKNVPDLEEIKGELENLRDKTLQNQYRKLILLKVISLTIILTLTVIVLIVHKQEIFFTWEFIATRFKNTY
ncbi:hypothetical protein [Flagellimonas lutaonensis]|uniref:Uncharacterized protein n=1 Tax=Flagellimonas lutaonensis TaxID=516051 RepID=A0A0D5YUX1_9FLAO|nr:hypothetical protein [Allomuricauda lutaonensis]AKA36020.1 hypothetical protein VC82_2443 [Allomuricauda lutaonensis]